MVSFQTFGEQNMQIETSTKDIMKPCFLIPQIYDPDDWRDIIFDQKTYTYEDYKKLPEGEQNDN